MNLPRFSLRNSTLVWLVLFVLTVWGAFNYWKISRREDPEIKIAMALVITIWPGASAEQVEQLVTKKIEDQVEEIGVVEKIESTSRENLSVLFVEVDFACDVDMAWQRLRNKVAEAELPEGVIGPDILDDFGDVTSMIYALRSAAVPPHELERYAEDLKAELRKVESVGKVELVGVQDEAVYIEGPLDSFTFYNFSPLFVARLIDYENVNKPSGYVRTDARNYRLEPSGGFRTLDQIRSAVLDVSKTTGHPLQVRDVFQVRQAYREPPFDRMASNGEPAVALDIRMKDGYNVVAMGEAVRAVAEAFKARLPQGVTLDLVHDQPRHVDDFINEFMLNLVEGLGIVILVLFLGMGWRAAAIVAICLPLSVILSFAFMPMLEVDLETVSIASFIIALGMLVDNAIIAVDNVDVYLKRGIDPESAARDGVQHLAVPILTGTAGAVFAFFPLLIMPDEIGAYIRSLPIVLCVSLTLSYVLALTLVPLAARAILRVSPKQRAAAARPPGWFMRAYARVMRGAMRWRFVVIGVAIATLVGSLRLMDVIGISFFPEADRDQLTVDVWLPEGAALTRTEQVVQEIEAVLRQDPDVASFVSYAGKGGPRFYISIKPEFNTPNYAQLVVTTKTKQVAKTVAKRLNATLQARIAGARITAAPLLVGIPVEAPIAFRITGPELDTMRELSLAIQNVLRAIPGTARVRDNLGENVPSLRVRVDTEAAMMAGVTNTEVAVTLLTAYDGLPVTKFRAGEDEIPVYLRLQEGARDIDNTLQALSVPSQITGKKVPLAALTTVQPEWAPGLIKRFNNRRSVTVLADTSGRLAADIMHDARPRIDAIEKPPGYDFESAGEEAERDKAFGDLAIVFGLIVAGLLMLMVMQFRSLKRALVILLSVPLAIVGALVGLVAAGESFSFMAFLGVVSLAGMVIKNAVVWVEYVEEAVTAGASLADAIVEAGRQRLRPIALTAATTVGGLIPLALFGGPLWRGMASAMIAGLTLATVLTLVIIPVLYYAVLHREVERRRKRTGPPSGPQGGAPTTAPQAPAPVAPGPAAPAPARARAAAALAVGLLLLGLPGAARAAHPLERYLELAERQGAEVLAAGIEVESAEADRLQAQLSFLPQLTFEASVTRLDRAQDLAIDMAALGPAFAGFALPAITLVDQNVYRTAVKVMLPLYVGGQRFAYLAAAEHGVRARTAAVRATGRGLRFGAAARYVQLLEAEARAALLREAGQTDALLVAAAQARRRAEMGTDFEVSYAETIAADTERRRSEAESEARVRQFAFNELTGQPLATRPELAPLRFDPGFAPDPGALLGALRRRPELTAYAEACSAADEKAEAAFGALLPTLALVGEGGYKEGDFGYTEGDGYGMATVALQWNLMSSGVDWARVKKARVEARLARQQYDTARRKLELELAEAIQQFEDIGTIYALALKAVATAAQGHANALAAYRAGVAPVHTVAEARKALTGAEENFVKAYFGRLLAELQVRYRAGLPLVTAVNLDGLSPLDELRLRVPALATGAADPLPLPRPPAAPGSPLPAPAEVKP